MKTENGVEVPIDYVFRADKDQIYGVTKICKCGKPIIVTEDGAQVCDGCWDFESNCKCKEA